MMRTKFIQVSELRNPGDADVKTLARWCHMRWPEDPAFASYGEAVRTFRDRAAQVAPERTLRLKIDDQLIGAVTLGFDDWGGIVSRNGLLAGRVVRDLVVNPAHAEETVDGIKAWERLVLAAADWIAARGESKFSFFVDEKARHDESNLVQEEWAHMSATIHHAGLSILMIEADPVEVKGILAARIKA